MVQFIITIIIVLAAGIIALTRFIRFFKSPPAICSGCSQSCGGCSLEELKKEIRIKNQKPDPC